LRARKLSLEKRYDEARSAYTEAIAERPDAIALGERGYVKLLSGDRDGAEEDLLLAIAAEGDATTLAQVWYNLGLAEQRAGDAEAARAAFARSLALSPSKAAEAKLGTGSRCAASVRVRPKSDASVAVGWLGVARALDLTAAAAQMPEKDARSLVCTTTQYSAAEPDIVHDCKESPPWRVSRGYMQFTWGEAVVHPAGKGRFFVLDLGRRGSWPARCYDQAEVTISVRAGVVHFTDEIDHKSTDDSKPSTDDGWSFPCLDGPNRQIDRVYSLAKGDLLVEVDQLAAAGVSVAIDARGSTLRLTGGSCDRSEKLAP
jgi:hypothetical protein